MAIATFLDLAYGAAVNPGAWPQVLESFAKLTGGNGSALVWQNQSDRSGQGLIAMLNPAILPTYFSQFARSHPSQRWTNSPTSRLRHFVPRIVADDDAMPKAELMRTPFYNEFMRPHDMHSIMRMGLTAQGHDAAFMLVARPRSRDRFGVDEVKLMAHLHGHLARAFDLTQRAAAAQLLSETGEALLDEAADAFLVVDVEGRILHANRAGEAMFAGDLGLRLVGGRLAAPTPADTARLQALIAIAGSPERTVRRGGSMGMTSPARPLPLSSTVTPLGAPDLPIIRARRRAVLVSISDLQRSGGFPQGRLRELFGLSRTEARVAEALFEGDTPREAADRLGVSFYTVRGHLVRIFEKTGVRRQSELIRLLTRLTLLG